MSQELRPFLILCAVFHHAFSIAELGQSCANDVCRNYPGISCVSGTCSCIIGFAPVTPSNGWCNPVALYHQPCNPPIRPCDLTLRCEGIGNNARCECGPNLVQTSAFHCGPFSTEGQPCLSFQPECGFDPSYRLGCISGSCGCLDLNSVPHPNLKCGPRAQKGQPCGPIPCLFGPELTCNPSSSTCVCSNGYRDDPSQTRTFCSISVPGLHNPCGLGSQCGADYSWNLRCHGSCICIPNNFEHPGGKCGPKGKLREACGPPDCDDTPGFNLWCNLLTRKCDCDNSEHVEHNGGRCGPPALHGETCGFPACRAVNYLQCINNVCQCLPGYSYNNGTTSCQLDVLLGEDCTNLMCRANSNMACDPGTSRCTCVPGSVPYPGRVCVPPAGFGQPCHPLPPQCGLDPSWNLTCVGTQCVCSSPDFVEHPGRRCGPPSRLGQACYPNPDCLTNAHLNCGPSRRCECDLGYFPKPDDTCGPPGILGEVCDSIPCKSGVNLECTGVSPSRQCSCVFPNIPAVEFPNNLAQTGGCGRSPPMTLGQKCEVSSGRYECKLNVNLRCDTIRKTCSCIRRWMELDPSTGGCKNRPLSQFNGPCELNEDCVPNGNLECSPLPFRKCGCVPLHEPDPLAGGRLCRRRLSRYDELCETDSHCLAGHEMICETTTPRRCRCKYSYDLENGVTPCRFSIHNGRTYGQPCESSPAVRRCVVSHNLTCQANRCICITNHVATTDTIQDPAFRVITCHLGRGTQGHSQDCVPAAANPGDRCDESIGLNCGGQLICSCADGYVPNDPRNNPTVPCRPGDRVYNSTCDPPEILVRPQPIDPNTGLPFPGPTSPPPPIFACNNSRNLVCFNGQCECRDERVSARYRYDSSTQICLVTPGYACRYNQECFTKRCVTRREAAIENGDRDLPSHDHLGTNICSGSVTPPGGFGRKLSPCFHLVMSLTVVTMTFDLLKL